MLIASKENPVVPRRGSQDAPATNRAFQDRLPGRDIAPPAPVIPDIETCRECMP